MVGVDAVAEVILVAGSLTVVLSDGFSPEYVVTCVALIARDWTISISSSILRVVNGVQSVKRPSFKASSVPRLSAALSLTHTTSRRDARNGPTNDAGAFDRILR